MIAVRSPLAVFIQRHSGRGAIAGNARGTLPHWLSPNRFHDIRPCRVLGIFKSDEGKKSRPGWVEWNGSGVVIRCRSRLLTATPPEGGRMGGEREVVLHVRYCSRRFMSAAKKKHRRTRDMACPVPARKLWLGVWVGSVRLFPAQKTRIRQQANQCARPAGFFLAKGHRGKHRKFLLLITKSKILPRQSPPSQANCQVERSKDANGTFGDLIPLSRIEGDISKAAPLNPSGGGAITGRPPLFGTT